MSPPHIIGVPSPSQCDPSYGSARPVSLPGIRDVLGNELCLDDIPSKPHNGFFVSDTRLNVSNRPISSSHLHTYSHVTPNIQDKSPRLATPKMTSARDDPFLGSSSNSMANLPTVLQRMRMEDDHYDYKDVWLHHHAPEYFYRPSMPKSWDICMHGTQMKRASSNDRMVTSRRPSGRSRDIYSRSMPRLGALNLSESQASTPINIPGTKEESYHPRTLTRSFSSYSTASGTSEGFPYTPKMGMSDVLTGDGRELGTEMTPSKPSNHIPQLILTENGASERQDLTPHVFFKNGHASPDQRSQDSPFGPHMNISVTKQKSPSAHLGKFQCNYCMKRFSRPSSLRTHIHSHTGEKPFRCDVPGCGRCFSVHSNLRRHQKSHSTSMLPTPSNDLPA